MENGINIYYQKNRDRLDSCFTILEKKINGRIPHKSITVLKILSELNEIRNYLEIGVHNGGSMGLILMSKNIETATGIDLFEDVYDIKKHLNKNKFDKYQYFKRDNLKKEKTLVSLKKVNNSTKLNLIQGNSYFDETENKVKNLINLSSIDLLFIDGDHTLDGVSNDYCRYKKFVKKNGFIVFDDYHHKDIKSFVDKIIDEDKDIEKIEVFKHPTTKAEDIILKIK